MHLKVEQRLLLLKFIVSYAVLFLLFKLPVTVFADKGEPVNPVHPNEILGLADANTGLETGHLSPNGNYRDWFQANYDQTKNVGVQWNRWAVEWSKVESSANPNQPPDYHWFCVWDGTGTVPAECPNDGDRYDYLRLAQEDEVRGINSLVVLTEIPGGYQTAPEGSRIVGLNTGIFNVLPAGTTDDPAHPNIDPNNPINTNNRWAAYFYEATVVLGNIGVHHWQIMNEMNLSEAWGSEQWRNDYIRVIMVADNILQYRQGLGEALDDQIIIGGSIYVYPGDNPNAYDWVFLMYEQLAIQMADPDIAPFSIDAVALHAYDRNKTTYDYPRTIYDYLEGLDNLYQVNLATKPLWLTETGSSSCADEVISGECPPTSSGTARSTDEEQSYYIIQSLAYAQSLPQMDRYFQFHLHEGCPHGPSEQTGYGLFHNWVFYHNVFVGSPTACAIEPHDGREKPAYQAFSQSSRWLRDFNGYSQPFDNNVSAEFLIFPGPNSRHTYVAWSRISDEVELRFYPSSELSGGPLLVISPDGTTEVLNRDGSGGYVLQLPGATNPIVAQEDGRRIIGGKPFIILEHLLFDLGAKPALFNPQEGGAKIQFGLNLPAGIISQDTVEIVIYDEMDTVVWTSSGVFSNGERYFVWDGLDTQTNDPVANGLYRYEISLPNQGNYTITGVVGVSQPGVLACFFNTTAPQPPDYYPPSPNEAFIDYEGSEIYSEISFSWDETPPIPELGDNENWIARYVGYLQVEDAGMYQFRMADTDDVARLFVDGVLLQMPDWITNEQGPFDLDSPEIYLSKGLHTLVIEHAQVTDSASLTLQWKQEDWWFWWTVDMLRLPGDDLTAVCEIPRHPFLNGDFEDGLDHWANGSNYGSHEISINNSAIWGLTPASHTGQYAVEGYIHEHIPSITLVSDLFVVAGGTCRTISLYVKEVFQDHDDWFFKVLLRWYDEQGIPVGIANPITISSETMPVQWGMVSGNIQIPTGVDSAELVLELNSTDIPKTVQGANYYLRVDDITLTSCP